MRGLLATFALGILALLLESAGAHQIPAPLCPDLGLLVVIAAAICLQPATGLCTAGVLGWAADGLSGALLGQHVLLRLAAFGMTRIAHRRLDLRRGGPLLVLAIGLSLGSEVGLAALSRLMGESFPLGFVDLRSIVLRAIATGLFAVPVVRIVERVLGQFAEGGPPRRSLTLDPRRPVL